MAKGKTDWKPLNSTCAKQVRFNREAGTLDVRYPSGRAYRYAGVSETQGRGIQRSTSPGRYLNRHIKPSHPVRKLPK